MNKKWETFPKPKKPSEDPVQVEKEIVKKDGGRIQESSEQKYRGEEKVENRKREENGENRNFQEEEQKGRKSGKNKFDDAGYEE